MKVFISFSGEQSEKIAKHLQEWLGSVIQNAKPFVSQSIPGGESWVTRIQDELAATHYGILCVTRANMSSPWLHYEAGALAKETAGKACPLLFGELSPTELEGPLVYLQCKQYSRQRMHEVVHEINDELPEPIPQKRVDKLFGVLWEDLDDSIQEALESAQQEMPDKRPVEDMVRETLQIVRNLNQKMELQQQVHDYMTALVRHTMEPREPSESEALTNYRRILSRIKEHMATGTSATTTTTPPPKRPDEELDADVEIDPDENHSEQ